MRGPPAVRRAIESVELAPDLVIRAEVGPSPFNRPIDCAICGQHVGAACVRITAFNIGGVQTKRGYPQWGICKHHEDDEVRAHFGHFGDQLLEHHLGRESQPTRPRLVHSVPEPIAPVPCSAVYWSLWFYRADNRRVADDHRPAQRTLWGIFEKARQTEPEQLWLTFAQPVAVAPLIPAAWLQETVDLTSAEAAEAIIEAYTPARRRQTQIAIVGGFSNMFDGVVRELAKRGQYTALHLNTYRKSKVNIPNADTYIILSYAAGSHAVCAPVLARAKSLGVPCIATPFKSATLIADAAVNSLSKGSGVNLRLVK